MEARKTMPAKEPKLKVLSAQWARAKVSEETARREQERLKREILEAGAEIGYEDEHLRIGSVASLDLEDKRLAKVLKDEGCFEQAIESKLVTKKVRALAEINERVRRVVDAIESASPRFEQVAKKS